MMAVEPVPTPAAPDTTGKRLSAEILVAAFLTLLLLAAFLVLPLAGSLALPFAAAPAVRLTHRSGLSAGLTAGLSAVALLSIFSLATGGPGLAAALAVFGAVVTGLPACAAAAVRRGLRPNLAYLGLCAAGFLCLAGGLFMRSAAGSASMKSEISSAFDQMADVAKSDPGGSNDGEAAARFKATLSGAKQFTLKFWPGLMGAFWVAASAVGFYVGSRLARPAASAEATRFEKLSLPAPVVAVFVAAGAGTVLGASPVREAAGNLLLPIAALYFLAGLSIICHFARKWFRGKILRAGLYALVVYFPVSIGVGLLGLFDWYADFRHRGEGAIKSS